MSIDSGALMVAAMLAIGTFFLVRHILIGQMSNVHNEATANAYMVDGSFQLTRQNDTYLYTNVTRMPKPRRQDRDD